MKRNWWLKSVPTEPPPVVKPDYNISRIDFDALERGIRNANICFTEEEKKEWASFIASEKELQRDWAERPELTLGMENSSKAVEDFLSFSTSVPAKFMESF